MKITEEQLQKDVTEALSIYYNLPSNVQKFNNYSPLYLRTTENQHDAYQHVSNKNNSTVLTVASCGDHIFNLLCRGFDLENIEYFDKNRLSQYYLKLSWAALQTLSYKEFLKFFSIPYKQHGSMITVDNKNSFNMESFYKCENKMDDDARLFWHSLFNLGINEVFHSPLFKNEFCSKEFLTKNNTYLNNKRNYLKVQKKLKDNKPKKFVHCDITSIPKEYANEKFDYVLLSNILQYHKDIPELESPYEINQFVTKKLSNILSDNGVAYVNYTYLFQTYHALNSPEIKRTIALGKMSPANMKLFQGPEGRLLEKWPSNYEFKTFPGVENLKSTANTPNGVLIHKKQR